MKSRSKKIAELAEDERLIRELRLLPISSNANTEEELEEVTEALRQTANLRWRKSGVQKDSTPRVRSVEFPDVSQR